MNRQHKHFLDLVIIMVLASLGCGSKIVQYTYFTMAYTMLPLKQELTPFPVSLRVRDLNINAAYDTNKIVYRFSPYRFQYYNYKLWAVKPHKLVTDLIFRHLEYARLFTNIRRDYGDKPPDYELKGTLHALEELDSGDEWYASLVFSLQLVRHNDGIVVWSTRVNAKKRVYNKEPVYVVKALSELMEHEMEKIVNELREFLKLHHDYGENS